MAPSDIEPTSSEPTMDPDFVVPYYMGKIDACVRKKKSDNEPFQITTCVLGAAQRKQLHHHCNKYHLESSSSGPEGQRRMTILSEWRFAPEKPMAPSVGDGAIDFLVARTKDGSAEMLRGKVTAHVIVGGSSHWTLRYHGGFEETVTIDTLNRRLQDRYILDHSGEFSLPNVEPPTTATDLGELRNKFLAGIDSNWQTSEWSKLGYDALQFMRNCQRMLNVDKRSSCENLGVVVGRPIPHPKGGEEAGA